MEKQESGKVEERLAAVDGPTIGIVTRGKVRVGAARKGEEEQLDLDEGGVFFVLPGNEIHIQVLEGSGPAGAAEVWWSLFDA